MRILSLGCQSQGIVSAKNGGKFKFLYFFKILSKRFLKIVEASTPKFGEWAERWDLHDHEALTGTLLIFDHSDNFLIILTI